MQASCISEKLCGLRLSSTTIMTDYFFQLLLIAFWSRRILGGSHSFKGDGRRIFPEGPLAQASVVTSPRKLYFVCRVCNNYRNIYSFEIGQKNIKKMD